VAYGKNTQGSSQEWLVTQRILLDSVN